MNHNKKIAIFPGSFDPFHHGHESVVKQSLTLFDNIYIVVTKNISKKKKSDFLKSQKEIAELFKDEPKVKVIINEDQLTAKIAFELKATFIIRGIRNEHDARYEIDASWINQTLNQKLTTILIPTLSKNHKVSSTLIREVANYGIKLNNNKENNHE